MPDRTAVNGVDLLSAGWQPSEWQGVGPMAVITIVLSGCLWGAVLRYVPGRGRRYLLLLPTGLASSALVNVAVKHPIGLVATAAAGTPMRLGAETPAWVLMVAWLAAPVCEEAVKALPLAFGRVRRLVGDQTDALWVGMALGFSFGLGEAAWVAFTIAADPEYSTLPWFVFTGYASERLVVCFGHGVMTALLVWGWNEGKAGRGYLKAVALHAASNIGPFLALIGVVSGAVAGIWTAAALLVMVALFERLRARAHRPDDRPGASLYRRASGVRTDRGEHPGRGQLLFDADCAFCQSSLRLLQRNVPSLPPAVPWRSVDISEWGLVAQDCLARIYWVEPDHPPVGGAMAFASALAAGRGLGPVAGGILRLPVVRTVAELTYRVVASNRHRLPGGSSACAVSLGHDVPAIAERVTSSPRNHRGHSAGHTAAR